MDVAGRFFSVPGMCAPGRLPLRAASSMRDRCIELVAELAAESGVLALYAILVEIKQFADRETFTTSQLCSHARVLHNRRLRGAIEAVCDGVSPRKLGHVLARVQGLDIGGLRVEPVKESDLGIVWRIRVCVKKPSAVLTSELELE